MRTGRMKKAIGALAVLAGVSDCLHAQPASLTIIAPLPGYASSRATGISWFGEGVSCSAYSPLAGFGLPSVTGFRWTQGGAFPTYPDCDMAGISGDAQTLVGTRQNFTYEARPVRFRGVQGEETLTPFPLTGPGHIDLQSLGVDYSGARTSVYPKATCYVSECVQPPAVVWGGHGTTVPPIPARPAGPATIRDISQSGVYVVGNTSRVTRGDGTTLGPPYRFSLDTGELVRMESIGQGDEDSAFGVSAYGTFVAGQSGTRALVWAVGQPPVVLAQVAGASTSWAVCVSEDGRTVGGTAVILQGDEPKEFAALWVDGLPHLLSSELVLRGAGLPDGSRLAEIADITPDGRRVVGRMYLVDGSMRGFLADLGRICPADVDNGSGTGTRDLAVTIDDLLYYLQIFELGDVDADLDDGSGLGTHDQAVTIDDLLYFLVHFEGGC